MSEEKKAIKYLKELSKCEFFLDNILIKDKTARQIIISAYNKLERQQKEIEELKEKNKNLIFQLKDEEKELIEVTQNIISKDKIREKIKEQRQKYFDVHDGKHSINEICFESTKVEGAVEILKELLEEN